MKYQFKEDLVDSFDIESVEIVRERSDSSVRRWIASGLIIILGMIIIGGLALSFKKDNVDVFKSLLSAVTPLAAIAIGYYFGTKEGNG